jgi:hypothetical protein
MPRAFSFNGQDWLAEPTGRTHLADAESFSIIRFWRNETGEEIEGRLGIEPSEFDSINEERIVYACRPRSV